MTDTAGSADSPTDTTVILNAWLKRRQRNRSQQQLEQAMYAAMSARTALPKRPSNTFDFMVPTPDLGAVYRTVAASPTEASEWTLLALLFATPDDPIIDALGKGGSYFDLQSGDMWDLYFPGYTKQPTPGSHPLGGGGFTSDWHFDPSRFADFRDSIQGHTQNEWEYMGRASLLLFQVATSTDSPVIDWTPVFTCELEGDELSAVVHKITRDQRNGSQSATFGMADHHSEPKFLKVAVLEILKSIGISIATIPFTSQLG